MPVSKSGTGNIAGKTHQSLPSGLLGVKLQTLGVLPARSLGGSSEGPLERCFHTVFWDPRVPGKKFTRVRGRASWRDSGPCSLPSARFASLFLLYFIV